MGIEDLRLLYINPSDITKAPDLPNQIVQGLEIHPDQLDTCNIANGDVLPTKLWKYSGVISGGARNSANDNDPWIRTHADFLMNLPPDFPEMDICFSHQARARALGGAVTHTTAYRFGVEKMRKTDEGRNDYLFDGLPDEFDVFVLNEDYVTRLPTDPSSQPTVLARSRRADNEALAYGPKRTIQWHPERTDEYMTSSAIIRGQDPTRPDYMLQAYQVYPSQSRKRRAAAARNGHIMLGNWMEHSVIPYHLWRPNPLPVRRTLVRA